MYGPLLFQGNLNKDGAEMFGALRRATLHYLGKDTLYEDPAKEERLRDIEYGTAEAPRTPQNRSTLWQDYRIVREVASILDTTLQAARAWLGRHWVCFQSGTAMHVTRAALDEDADAEPGRPYSLFRRAFAYCSLYEFGIAMDRTDGPLLNNALTSLICNLHVLEESRGWLGYLMEWSVEQACGRIPTYVKGVPGDRALAAAKAVLRCGAATSHAHQVRMHAPRRDSCPSRGGNGLRVLARAGRLRRRTRRISSRG